MINKDVTHRRNIVLFSLIVLYYFTQASINIVIEGAASIFPPAFFFMLAAAFLFLLIIKKINPTFTMYSVVVFTYMYFFFLLTDSPYLVNYLFMWLGLPLSAIYQNYRAILMAGIGSLLLTFYAYYVFHEDIFPNVGNEDFVYLLLFGLFLTGFFLLFIRITLDLWNKIEESSKKLNDVLEKTDIIVWSYDRPTDTLSLSSHIPNLQGRLEKRVISGDYLIENYIHPEDTHILRKVFVSLKKGERHSVKFRIVNNKGEITWMQCRGVSFINENKMEGILLDITKQQDLEEYIKRMAYYDSLTGAANRNKLKETFESLQKRASTLAILFVDLNSFKQVNDTYGHDFGDRLLQQVSTRIQAETSESDLLCRMGGDEFVILLSNTDEAILQMFIHRIEEVLNHPFKLGATSIYVSASIGRSPITKANQANLEKMLQQADTEMYKVKAHGDVSHVSLNQ